MNRDVEFKRLTSRRLPNEEQVILNEFSNMLDICVNFCIDIQLLIEKSGKLNMKNIPILATLVHFRDTLDSYQLL